MAENKLLDYKDDPELLIGRWVLRLQGNYRVPQKSLHRIARVTRLSVTLTSQDKYRIDTGQRMKSVRKVDRFDRYIDEIQLLSDFHATCIQNDWRNAAEHRKLLDELRPRLALADNSHLKEIIALLDSKLLTPDNEDTNRDKG